MRLEAMAQLDAVVDPVVILTPDFFAREITSFFKLGNNPLDSALGNPNRQRDLTQRLLRIARETDQHMGVISEKSPLVGL